MISRKYLIVPIILITLAGIAYSNKSIGQTEQNSVKDNYSTEWSQVYQYIEKNWGETVVVNKELPEPFLAAWKKSPTFFYFDNYFINKGALEIDSLSIYSKDAIDDCIFLINKFGFVPNFNDKEGEDRSQTPYLSMMVRDVYSRMEIKDTAWLRQSYIALLKEYRFWADDAIENHSTGIPELQHYGQHATQEELVGFYRRVLPGRLGIKDSTLTKDEMAKVAAPYVTEAEAMDFTPRFDRRAPGFVAVELNSNLYLYEKNFAWMEKILRIKSGVDWTRRSEERKEQIQKYLWDERRGLFMDYDYKNRQFGKIACITSVAPLYAGIATPMQAKRFVENLSLFEYKYGISICEKNNYPSPAEFQFDYPANWAAFTVLTIMGLDRYGYKDQAKRIAIKFLDVVTKNFFYPEPKQTGHNLYEKYNAVNGQINGAGYGYGLNKFFGFTAGGFVWCYNYLKRG